MLYRAVKDYLKLQISYNGGAWTESSVDGLPGSIGILPGSDSVVKFVVTSSEHAVARIFYPNMKPLSAPLLLQDPLQFANLMHNIDCQLHRGFKGGVPISFSDFLREAVFSNEKCVIESVARATSNLPVTLDIKSYPYIKKELCWNRCSDDDAIFDCISLIRDLRLKALAEQADLLFRKEIAIPNALFDERASIVSWHEVADRLQTRERKIFPEVFDVDDFVWVRLHTASAVVAEARYLGIPESKVLGKPKDGWASNRGVLAFQCPHTPTEWIPAATKTQNVMDLGREYWSLRTQSGERILLLRIEFEQDKVFFNRDCDYDERIVSNFVTELFIYRCVRELSLGSKK